MWKTTIRGLRAHKVRLVSTTLAIVLGVGFMAGTLVLTDTVGKSFDDLLATSNAGVDVAVRGVEQVESQSFYSTRPNLSEDVVDTVAAVDGVAIAEGYLDGFAQIVGTDGEALGSPNGAPTFGQSWVDTEALNPWKLAEGETPSGSDEVVIDRGSAKAGSIAVGDEIAVLSGGEPRTFTVSGIVTWGEVDSPLGASAAIFDLPTAQDVLQLPGEVTTVYAVASDGVSQDELATRVQAAVGDDSEVITGEALIVESQNEVAEGLAFFNTFLRVFALIALFVGSFIIYNTFSILVAQRSRELALLRALGAGRSQVLRSVLLEAVAVGVIASGLGLVAGVGLSLVLRGALAGLGLDIPATGTVIEAGSMISAFVTGFVITMVAAVIPARRASRVPPIAAMREVALDRTATSVGRIVAGAIVTTAGVAMIFGGLFGGLDNGAALVGLGAAVTFIGVFVIGPVLAAPVAAVLEVPIRAARGITGRLAGENARRNPRRTAASAVALTIGVSLVGFISIFAASATASINQTIDDNFTGDFVLTTGGFGPGSGFSPELADAVEQLDEVGTVAEVRFGIGEIEGDSGFYSAVDPVQANELFDIGVAEGSIDELLDDGIAVYDQLATDKGWAVGDTLTVTFPETGDVELPLLATFERQEIAGPAVIGMGTHEANTGTQLDLQAAVQVADGASVDDARVAIETEAEAYPNVEVQNLAEYKDEQAAQINQFLAMIYVMLFLAVVIALIGIANTLTLSIYERTHELGLLRAVGLTRSQLRSSVRWESVIIALFGTLLGLAVGLFFGWALVRALADQGFNTFTVPVAQLVVITLLAALAGVVAGLRPASRAAKLQILDAIATE